MKRKLILRWALFFGGAACLIGWYLRSEAGIEDAAQGNIFLIGVILLGVWFMASKDGWGTGTAKRRRSDGGDGTCGGGFGGHCGDDGGGDGGD